MEKPSPTTIIGIDPGLVHSGIVRIRIYSGDVWEVDHRVVEDGSVTDIVSAVEELDDRYDAHVFIEKYRDRSTGFNTHGRMREMEFELKQLLPKARLIDNTGVKKIVTRELMQLLRCWKFPTTNHQDLQAAARIGLYGALKNEELNAVISQVVSTQLGIHNNKVMNG